MWVGVFFKVAILPTICATLSPSLNPPLVTGNRAPICAVIRPNPACRLGRNIIKTSLCCHGNRDLNKFIFLCVCVCMCVFQGLFGIGLVWRLVRVTDRDARCCCSVFSHPHSCSNECIYLVINHHGPSFSIITISTVRCNYYYPFFGASAVCTVCVCILQCMTTSGWNGERQKREARLCEFE